MKKETLYRFFDGSTTLEEEYAIRKWMEDSPENEEVFDVERRLYDAILINAELGSEQKKSLKTYFSPRACLNVLKYAAIVILTLSISFAVQFYDRLNTPIAMQSISVPEGQRINITLPDGTNVWLNALTTLTYPTSFHDVNKRIVTLDGEGYFDVTHDEEVPFIVETSKCQIEVLGTEFNVQAYHDEDFIETALMKGSVKLSCKQDPSHFYTLVPDTKATLKDSIMKIEPVDDYGHYRWKEGLICFKDQSFQTIAAQLKKHYGVSFVISNKRLNNYRYTGKFRQSDGLEHNLRVLQRSIAFTYHRDDEKNIIYIQ